MRYLLTFSYDGADFYGYQKQPNKRTIQEEIEKILSQINNKKIIISSSGRTDAKVHALNQKAHFDSDVNYDLDKLKNSMNKMLPSDIYIKDVKQVSNDFHARFNVVKKEYIYKLNVGEYSPIARDYIYQYNKDLNLDEINKSLKYLIGTHNFKSVTKADSIERDYIRTIYDIRLEKKDNIITFTFIGSGFLRYMIRNIMGLLISVGENKIKPVDIKNIIEKEDRKEASKTAPPEGLYLSNVYYDQN